MRRHIVPSVSGRVSESPASSAPSAGSPIASIPGLYVAGWLKRGPSGIIATNIMDARETVKSIVQDLKEGVIREPDIGTPLPLLAPSSSHYTSIVDRTGWSRIDAYEQARGLEQGKPRVKLVEKEQMMEVVRGKR